jgi:predicted DNA-binding protein (MmcQ/YjbR family)
MPKRVSALAKLREICLALPDTRETLTWGEPHFRVGDKIFAGCGKHPGVTEIGFKLEREHADARVESDPRFKRAPYVGHKGWVSMDTSSVRDWKEVRMLILESYGLIAPKRTLASLAALEARPPKPRARSPRPR